MFSVMNGRGKYPFSDTLVDNGIIPNERYSINNLIIKSKPESVLGYLGFDVEDTEDINTSAFWVNKIYMPTMILPVNYDKSVIPAIDEKITVVLSTDSILAKKPFTAMVRLFMNERGHVYPTQEKSDLSLQQWQKMNLLMGVERAIYRKEHKK